MLTPIIPLQPLVTTKHLENVAVISSNITCFINCFTYLTLTGSQLDHNLTA